MRSDDDLETEELLFLFFDQSLRLPSGFETPFLCKASRLRSQVTTDRSPLFFFASSYIDHHGPFARLKASARGAGRSRASRFGPCRNSRPAGRPTRSEGRSCGSLAGGCRDRAGRTLRGYPGWMLTCWDMWGCVVNMVCSRAPSVGERSVGQNTEAERMTESRKEWVLDSSRYLDPSKVFWKWDMTL